MVIRLLRDRRAFALLAGLAVGFLRIGCLWADAPDPPHPSSLSLTLQPALIAPLIDSVTLFGMGGGMNLGVEYALAGNPQVFASCGLEYSLLPVNDAASSVSLVSALAGVGSYFWLSPRLAIKLGAQGGYYAGFFNDGGEPSGQLALRGGASLEYLLAPTLNLSLGAAYRYDLGTVQGVTVAASVSYFIRGREGRELVIDRSKARAGSGGGPRTPEKGRGIELANLEMYEVFPVFHKYYDDHPVGLVTLVNREKAPVGDIRLSLWIKQYMDSPKASSVPADLAAGARQDVSIMSLLTDRVLEVTEATKVAADLVLEYTMAGDSYRDARTITVRILDRNAMTWEEDSRAAAFVTAKDPAVLTFAKGAVGPVRDRGPQAVDGNLAAAMGLFTALDLHGVSYVVDPKTPHSEFAASRTQVDFLQFPRQTLEYKAGDCDDLSILYAALLESVGIETAFITVPGHIFLAFATALPPAEARRSFPSAADLIEREGQTWVPVEVTERRGGFLKACATGAKEWREAQAAGTAGFLPIHEAWQKYEPVGFPGAGPDITAPARDALLSAFDKELGRFVDQLLGPQAARLQEEIRTRGGSPEARNRLGVLYARFGRYEKAEVEFRAAAESPIATAAFINLGNLKILQGQPDRAREFFDRAAEREPRNPKVLLGIARCYHELEKFDQAMAAYQELAKVDRALAERNSYLAGVDGTEGRAASVDETRHQVAWAE